MEKWKIGTIAVCLAIPVLYGLYQDKLENTPSTPSAGSPTPGPTPAPPAFMGKVPPAWNLSQDSLWYNSKPVALEKLKGHYALVEIFRINCSHCQEMAPVMVAINARYTPRGLQMIGIQSPGQFKDVENTENDPLAVKSWLHEHGVTYPVAFDKGSKYFQGTLKGTYYPTVMILDPAGKVVFHQTGDDAEKCLKLISSLEKAMPAPGTVAQRAKELAAWLRNFAFYANSGPDLETDLRGRLSK